MSLIRRIKWKIRSYINTFFGNSAGVMNNIIGLLSSRRFYKTKFSDKAIEFWRTKGYFLHKSAISEQILKSIHDEFLIAIKDPQNIRKNEHKKHSEFAFTLKNVNQNLPSAKSILTSEIKNILNQRFNGKYKIIEFIPFRIFSVPKDIYERDDVYAQFWHCDGDKTSAEKMFINLTDVTDQDGPIECLDIQTTQQVMNKGYLSRSHYGSSSELLSDSSKHNSYIGAAGDVMFCSTSRVLHRQTSPAEGRYRDFLMIHVEASEESLSSNWFEQLSDYKFSAPA